MGVVVLNRVDVVPFPQMRRCKFGGFLRVVRDGRRLIIRPTHLHLADHHNKRFDQERKDRIELFVAMACLSFGRVATRVTLRVGSVVDWG